MKYISLKYLIVLLMTYTPIIIYAASCEKFLVNIPNQNHQNLNFDVNLTHLKDFKNSTDVLNRFKHKINSSGVRFHTSRSIHRASEAHPRLVFIDDHDPLQVLVYAFSLRPELSPILELQHFDIKTGQTNLYQADWDEKSELIINKNPRQCFNCHSGGRPLYHSMSSRSYWPFAFSQDHKNAGDIESKLASLNNKLQIQRLNNLKPDVHFFNLLSSALHDDDDSFERNLSRYKNTTSISQIHDFYFEQKDIFYHFMGYQHPKMHPFFNDADLKTLRILNVFHLFGIADYLDLFSLNIRPRNFELNSRAFQDLEQWIKDRSQSQK